MNCQKYCPTHFEFPIIRGRFFLLIKNRDCSHFDLTISCIFSNILFKTHFPHNLHNVPSIYRQIPDKHQLKSRTLIREEPIGELESLEGDIGIRFLFPFWLRFSGGMELPVAIKMGCWRWDGCWTLCFIFFLFHILCYCIDIFYVFLT